MREEWLVVQAGLVKVKDVKVWHCWGCGRTEYSGVSLSQDSSLCRSSREAAQDAMTRNLTQTL